LSEEQSYKIKYIKSDVLNLFWTKLHNEKRGVSHNKHLEIPFTEFEK